MKRVSFLLFALFFLRACPAHATDIYVAQSVAGSNTGANCANARALASLVSADWSPGNTIHLCGTITSQVVPANSGTMGSVITIFFEPNAAIAMPTCGATGCIDLAGLNYILVDGGTACGVISHPIASSTGEVFTACNGTIEATMTGSGGLGSVSGTSVGIYALSNASNVEIRNLNIVNQYVRNGNNGSDGSTGPFYAVHFNGANVFVHNCIMHDEEGGVVGEAGSNNSEISNIYGYNINHDIFLSGPGTNTPDSVTQVKIHDNELFNWWVWDSGTNTFHHDAIIVAGNNNLANGVSHISVYNNYLHGLISQSSVCASASGSCMTALIFMNDGNHFQVFNNLLAPGQGVESGAGFVNNGWIFLWSPGTLNANDVIANNTVIGNQTSHGACIVVEGDASMTLQNNVMSTCNSLIRTYTAPATTFTALSNNTYQNTSLTNAWQQCTNSTCSSSTYYSTLGDWQTATSADTKSQATTGSLQLNVAAPVFSPTIISPLIQNAANLSSLSITALDSDMLGLLRPLNGPWDQGAMDGPSSVQIPTWAW